MGPETLAFCANPGTRRPAGASGLSAALIHPPGHSVLLGLGAFRRPCADCMGGAQLFLLQLLPNPLARRGTEDLSTPPTPPFLDRGYGPSALRLSHLHSLTLAREKCGEKRGSDHRVSSCVLTPPLPCLSPEDALCP